MQFGQDFYLILILLSVNIECEKFTCHVNFGDSILEIFYRSKKVEKMFNKKLKSKNGKQLQKRLDELEGCNVLEDMRNFKGARLERLSNNRDGQYSVRVNDKYRIIFIPESETDPLEIRNVTLIDFSNHYK